MLTISLLGPPRIEINGKPIDFGTNKAVALLAYLAANPRDQSRSELATFLWPEYGDSNSAASLRQTLWTLRRNGVADDYLQRDRHTIGLIQSPELVIDIRAFQSAIADCQLHDPFEVNRCAEHMDVLVGAVSLYQGDFMAGFTLKDSTNFDDWQSLQSRHFQREFIKLLEVLVYCCSAQRNFAAATVYCRRLVECDPLEEQHHRSLMQLYAAEGKRAAAIQQYEICQKTLAEELGIPPSEETIHLYEAVKSGIFPQVVQPQHPGKTVITSKEDQSPPADVRARLYDQAELIIEKPRYLVGREETLEQIIRLVNTNERILLTGLGGIGKTSLAAVAAARFLDRGEGPVLWVSIGHATTEIVMERIAALKPPNPLHPPEEHSVAVRKMLLEQRGLVVLDNAFNERTLFYVMQSIPPTIPVIVTSRHIIPVEGEIIHVSSLSVTNALNLLSYHSRTNYEDDQYALELCECFGYHPYAIEIAGKNLQASPDLTPEYLLAQVSEKPHDMSIPGNYAPFGRESIKSLLDTSVDALSADALKTFTAIGSLFAPYASIQLLTDILERPQTDVVAVVDNLRRHGLVEIIEAGERVPTHYQLHDLTFSYARGLSGEEDNAQILIDAITRFVDANKHDYDLLDLEQPNILSAANHAKQFDNKQALIDIMRVILVDGYLDYRGHSAKLLELADAAIEATRQVGGDRKDLHFMLSKQGNAYADQALFDHALQAYQEALEYAPTDHRRALILSVIGGVRVRQGADDYESYFNQAYKLAESIGAYEVMSRVLLHQGITAAEYLKQPESAREWFAKAVEVAQRLGEQAVYLPLYNQGVVELDLGNFQVALEIHQRCLEIALKSGNDLWIADSTSAEARGYHGLGQRDKAQAGFERALALYRKYGAERKVDWLVKFMQENGYRVPE